MSRRGRRDTPVYPGPVTRAHVAAIWPACCWGSPPGALLLTGTSAFYSRQCIWERSGLRAGAESQPRRGAAPTPHPRDSLLDAGHHRCVTSLVQERGEAAGRAPAGAAARSPAGPRWLGTPAARALPPPFFPTLFLYSSFLFSRALSSLPPSLSFPAILSVSPSLSSSSPSSPPSTLILLVFFLSNSRGPCHPRVPLEVGARVAYRALHRRSVYFRGQGLGSGRDPSNSTPCHTLLQAF